MSNFSVLTYHRICKIDDNFVHHRGVVSATPELFEAQLKFLKARRTLITTNDLLEALQKNKQLPPRATIITFDDGYIDNYTNAFPILKRQQLAATFFITTGFIDQKSRSWSDDVAVMLNTTKIASITINGIGTMNLTDKRDRLNAINKLNSFFKHQSDEHTRNSIKNLVWQTGINPSLNEDRLFMNWAEVDEMKRAGMIFAPHTKSHINLEKADINIARNEIRVSQAKLAVINGYKPETFAYPYGKQIPTAVSLQRTLHELGIKIAFTTDFGPNKFDSSTNYLTLRRYNVHNSVGLSKFKIMLWNQAYHGYTVRQKLRHRLRQHEFNSYK